MSSSAAEMGDLDTATTLINLGAHLNLSGNQRITPLIAAGNHGHTKIIELLMHNGAKQGH